MDVDPERFRTHEAMEAIDVDLGRFANPCAHRKMRRLWGWAIGPGICGNEEAAKNALSTFYLWNVGGDLGLF